jgi:hypothetical protein
MLTARLALCPVSTPVHWSSSSSIIEAALGDNTQTQIDISSVNGLNTPFHRKRESGSECLTANAFLSLPPSATSMPATQLPVSLNPNFLCASTAAFTQTWVVSKEAFRENTPRNNQW